MANYWALSAGNWSNVSNWLTGTSPGDPAGALPGPEDDVFANNRVIHIDGNFAAKSITNLSAVNTARRGGYFTMESGVSLSANVRAGDIGRTTAPPYTTCLQFLSTSPASATLIGSLCAGIDPPNGSLIDSPQALINFGNFTIIGNVEGQIVRPYNTSSSDRFTSHHACVVNLGNLTVYGNVSGNRFPVTLAGYFPTSSIGIRNQGTGRVNIYGSVYGGMAGTDSIGIVNATTGTVYVAGSAFANAGRGDSQNHWGIANIGGGTVLLSGTVAGGVNPGFSPYQTSAIYSNSGVVEITGSVIGGSRDNAGANAHMGLQLDGGTCLIVQDERQEAIVSRGLGNGAWGVRQNGGTLVVRGNVQGGNGYLAWGLYRAGGITTIYGNVRGAGETGISLNGGTGGLTIVGDLSGGATGGGTGLYCRAGSTVRSVTISGDLYSSPGGGMAFADEAGTANCQINIYGNLYGRPASTANSGPIDTRSNGTINIFGDLIYRSNTYTLVRVYTGNKTINLVGNIRPLSPNISQQYGGGIRVEGADAGQSVTVNVTGDVVGGTVSNTSGGGNGSGIVCFSSNTNFVNVYGTVKGGLAVPGIQNFGSATTIYVTRVVGNDVGPSNTVINGIAYSAGQPGIQNSSANGRVFVEEIAFGSQGATPVSGPVFMVPKSTNVTVLNTGPTTGYTSVTLFRSTNFPGFAPEERDVRQGVVYGAGEFTGTMIVPSPDAVQLGVPVDNTRGRAALTPISVWNFSRNASLSAGSIGERVRNALTIQAAGKILASFNLSGAS